MIYGRDIQSNSHEHLFLANHFFQTFKQKRKHTHNVRKNSMNIFHMGSKCMAIFNQICCVFFFSNNQSALAASKRV